MGVAINDQRGTDSSISISKSPPTISAYSHPSTSVALAPPSTRKLSTRHFISSVWSPTNLLSNSARVGTSHGKQALLAS